MAATKSTFHKLYFSFKTKPGLRGKKFSMILARLNKKESTSKQVMADDTILDYLVTPLFTVSVQKELTAL